MDSNLYDRGPSGEEHWAGQQPQDRVKLEVIAPFSLAWDRMNTSLFGRTASVGKWFLLGFVVFLATCEGQTVGSNYNQFSNLNPSGYSSPMPPQPYPQTTTPGPGSNWSTPPNSNTPLYIPQPYDPQQRVREIEVWLASNMGWLVPVVTVAALVLLAVGALINWLSCRGRFMFDYNLMHDSAEISSPWREYAPEANRLFVFRFSLQLVCWYLPIVFAGFVAWATWRDIIISDAALESILPLLIAGVFIVLLSLAFSLIDTLVYNFAVPAMLLNRVGVREGWRLAYAEVITGNIGSVILYYLFKLLIVIAGGIVGFAAICLTCCIGALPYLSSVLLLPISYLTRAYTLAYVQQGGPQWALLLESDDGDVCPACGYSLIGLDPAISHTCPECGEYVGHLLLKPPSSAGFRPNRPSH